ncbi:MAG: UpxY family transcription antiterminator [Pseudomonadota bacterium]
MKFDKQWFALLTKSRFENVVNTGIEKKSIEVFLPKIRVRSKRKDRKLMIDLPLFPGYLFVKISPEPEEQLRVLKTNGAVRLLGYKDGPVPVPSEQIESLRIITGSGLEVFTGSDSRLKQGESVMVINGPFAGVKGEFVKYKGKNRVLIKIDALAQFAGVEIDEEDIERLPPILS